VKLFHRLSCCLQELFFIMAGTLNVTLSFNSDGDTRLSRPGDRQAATKSFSYGPGDLVCSPHSRTYTVTAPLLKCPHHQTAQ
jgi:hypothetical protein